MFLRKINNVDGQRVRAGTMAVDPHGDLVCVYEQERGEFLLLEVDSFLKHFQYYRLNYEEENCYDNRDPIPCRAVLRSDQILEMYPTIKFSERVGDTQCLVLYFCTFIEVLKLHLGSWAVLFRVTYKMTSEILEANIIGQQVYVSMYDGSLIHICLRSLEKTKKEEACRKLVRASGHARESLGAMESLRLEEGEEGVIWQSFCGRLMRDKRVLCSEYEDNFDYSNSFEEYIGKEVNEKHPVKYEMSPCRGYIIGSSTGKIVAANSSYSLKPRWADWATVCELNFKPEINPFWKSHQEVAARLEEQGPKRMKLRSRSASPAPEKGECSALTDRVLIAMYNQSRNVVTVAWLLVSKNKRKRMAEGECVKYKADYRIAFDMPNPKRPVAQLKWIGLNQLLLIDTGFKLHYMEFDEDDLE